MAPPWLPQLSPEQSWVCSSLVISLTKSVRPCPPLYTSELYPNFFQDANSEWLVAVTPASRSPISINVALSNHLNTSPSWRIWIRISRWLQPVSSLFSLACRPLRAVPMVVLAECSPCLLLVGEYKQTSFKSVSRSQASLGHDHIFHGLG